MIDPAAFYVQADVGLGLLSRVPYNRWFSSGDVVAVGAVANGAVGWLPIHGNYCASGLEASAGLLSYSGGENIVHTLAVLIVIEANIR